jgi:hypothetical protein
VSWCWHAVATADFAKQVANYFDILAGEHYPEPLFCNVKEVRVGRDESSQTRHVDPKAR